MEAFIYSENGALGFFRDAYYNLKNVTSPEWLLVNKKRPHHGRRGRACSYPLMQSFSYACLTPSEIKSKFQVSLIY